MDDLKALIDTFIQIMQIPFTIWGFTLSFWDIMLALLVGGIVISLIGGFFRE